MDPLQVMFILFVINIPVFILIGKKFFTTWDRFVEALKANTRSRRSMFRPQQEADNDRMPAMALGLFAFTCGAVVVAEIFLLNWLTGIFDK